MPIPNKDRKPFVKLSWQDCDTLLKMIGEIENPEFSIDELVAIQKLERIKSLQLQSIVEKGRVQ